AVDGRLRLRVVFVLEVGMRRGDRIPVAPFFMRKWTLSLLSLPALFGAFLLWALSPAVSSHEFPHSAILQNADLPREKAKDRKSLKIVTYNIGYASGEKNNRPLT